MKQDPQTPIALRPLEGVRRHRQQGMRRPRRQPSRREVLAGVTGIAIALAGCVGDDDDDDDDDAPDDTDDTDDDAPAEETDDDDEPDDTSDDEPDDDADEGDETDDEEIPDVDPEDLPRYEGDFRFEAIIEAEGTEMSGRVHGDNQYLEFVTDGETGEQYFVDETLYTVTEGQCFIMEWPMETLLVGLYPIDMREVMDTPEWEAETENVTFLGTDTVEGNTVDVYEMEVESETLDPETGDVEQVSDTVTWYVDVTSGIGLRVESVETGTTVTWTITDTEPVEPPDMECQGQPGY